MNSTQSVKCDKCGTEFQIPVALDQRTKAEIVHLFRNDKKLQAIRMLNRSSVISLTDSKAFSMHFQTKPGACHQCGRALQLKELGTCSHCRSLNINWKVV